MDGRTANNQIVVNLPPDFGGNSKTLDELKEITAEIRREFRNISERLAPVSYTEKELAKHFGISLLTMERIRRAGKVSYTRVGGKIHYTRKQIEDYLESTQTSRTGRK